MRPTPGELAEGMRALLRAAGREVTSDVARTQIRRIMHVLKTARWDDAAFDLMRENDLLRSALGAVAADRPDHHRLTAQDSLPRDFAEANARNLALRSALTDALDALRAGPLANSAEVRRTIALKFLDRP